MAEREAAAPAAPAAKRPSASRSHKVIVRIDWDALVRGTCIEGEVSEIPGFGSVPVSWVQALIDSGDAFLAAVVTKGVDVVSVAHLGRQ